MLHLSRPLCAAVSIAVSSFTAATSVDAQDKYERERNVKASEVPAAARSWLRDAFEEVRSPKWYQEIYESGYSYEAKFKWRGQYYSVEFGPGGTIQDVEIEVGFADLPATVQQRVNDYLSATYQRVAITRLQIQYTGAPDDLEDFFDEDQRKALTVRYEIEYTATTGSAPTHYREGLFDHDGVLLQSRRVVLPTTDNLIF